MRRLVWGEVQTLLKQQALAKAHSSELSAQYILLRINQKYNWDIWMNKKRESANESKAKVCLSSELTADQTFWIQYKTLVPLCLNTPRTDEHGRKSCVPSATQLTTQ